MSLSKMTLSLRSVIVAGLVATLLAVTVALAVIAANRPPVLITTSTGSPGTVVTSTFSPVVMASGEATVSKRPDMAFISVGVESQKSTAAAAQADLATKASKLIAKAKALGIADKDINTAGYWVGPNYTPDGGISGYRASEDLQLKWRNVDTTGKTLDALVQEGDATRISVGFGLADPKAAQAEARPLAIADARSKAQAMAAAAGVKLGQVVRISDASFSGWTNTPNMFAGAAMKDASQVPVGQLDIQATVEVDFAISG
jgi:uncharacterized protein YggE